MKLFDCQGAPNPRRIRIFLAEKGIDIDCAQIDVFKGEQYSDAFRQINPSRAVPCVQLDDGAVISETAAIARYFEAQKPEPSLLGESPKDQGQVAMWQRRVEDGLMNAATTYFHHATDGLGEADRYRNKEWGEANKARLLDTMRWIDSELESRDYIAGDTFSFADITALCAIDFAALLAIDIPEDCTRLKAWRERVAARPSIAA